MDHSDIVSVNIRHSLHAFFCRRVIRHRADLSTSSTEIGGHLDPDDPHNDYLGEDSDDAEGTDYTRYSTTTHEDRIDNAVLRDEGETTQIATDAVAPTEAQVKDKMDKRDSAKMLVELLIAKLIPCDLQVKAVSPIYNVPSRWDIHGKCFLLGKTLCVPCVPRMK